MTLAQINIDTIRSAYNGPDADTYALETQAAATGGELDHDWEQQETTISYPDGSYIVCAGPTCDAYAPIDDDDAGSPFSGSAPLRDFGRENFGS